MVELYILSSSQIVTGAHVLNQVNHILVCHWWPWSAVVASFHLHTKNRWMTSPHRWGGRKLKINNTYGIWVSGGKNITTINSVCGGWREEIWKEGGGRERAEEAVKERGKKKGKKHLVDGKWTLQRKWGCIETGGGKALQCYWTHVLGQKHLKPGF